jgi:hypothetical protein
MKILDKQAYHFFSLLLLLGGIFWLARDDFLGIGPGGLTTKSWLILSILSPIIHQVYVLICWRGELYYSSLTKIFGKIALHLWAAGFMFLFISRPVLITGLAVVNQGSLVIGFWVRAVLIGVCSALVIYLAYSFIFYFGAKRALGEDHFKPEVYRNMPMVRQGIFRWSSNAMYLFGFLFLWIPGLYFNSRAALVAALFNHLYIWVHYYFTELPDMEFIYLGK